MPTELVIVGAGGHAKVVIEALKVSDHNCRIVSVDEDNSKVGIRLLSDISIQLLADWSQLPSDYHVAIGHNRVRRKMSDAARKFNKQALTIIHPSAQVSPSASLAEGCFIAALSVIAAEAQIDDACIINHGSVIDHDCSIGAYTHVAPNVTLGGGVKLGRECLIGAGATVLPGVKIGHNVVVGAGAVVTRDVADNKTVIGIPAR